jgi:sulfotransferase
LPKAFEDIFFISGLPRSGSTLLGSILRQNPAISAGMTSPMYSLVNGLLPRLSNANEFNVFISNDARRRLLRGLFHNFYEDLGGKIAFDTNRHWTSKLPLLLELFPDTRFICCVRPIPEIVQSFEALFAARPAELSRIMNFDPETNVYTRTDHLMSGAGIVGFPLNALKDAFFGPHSDRLMLISYANLCGRPEEVLAAIYEFLQIEGFAHDFGNVAFDADAYDRGIGLPGLHRIRSSVKAQPLELSLPPDLIARLTGPYFWEVPPQGARSHLDFARKAESG